MNVSLKNPRRYFEEVDEIRGAEAAPPVCLYLEVTNRCNLLCETCPRTFEDLEPPADMSWELFTSIIDQAEHIARVVMHGVGEPMLVKNLPDMIRYCKARGIYTLFNTNGTLLTPRKQRELIETGLDELRVSLDAADAKTFLAVRGKDFFNRIVRNISGFTALQKEMGAEKPLVSMWLTGLKETIGQLPDFVRLRLPSACGKCICSGWFLTRRGLAWRARSPRCSRRRGRKSRRRLTPRRPSRRRWGCS